MLRTIVTDRHGFRLTVAEDYVYLLDGTSLDPLFALAAGRLPPGGWGSSPPTQPQPSASKQITQVQLPGGLRVHAKYWVPRRASRRMKTLWRRDRIAWETKQYIRFEEASLPVVKFVLSAVRRLPLPGLGVYLTGFVATRSMEGAPNLWQLLRERHAPWMAGGRDRANHVLEALGQMLASVHQHRLTHGDFTLWNILYTPGHTDPPYQMVDLATETQALVSEDGTRYHQYRDLLRTVVSIARSGLTQSHALQFLGSYLQAWDSSAEPSMGAHDLLELCLSARDHRPREAARYFGAQAR